MQQVTGVLGLALSCALSSVLGCSDTDDARSSSAMGGVSTGSSGGSTAVGALGGGGSVAAGAPGESPTNGGETGGSSPDAGGDAAGGDTGAPSVALEAPAEEQALLAFLQAKGYAGWAKEAEYHQSAGPHGGGVRVYYSPKAVLALASGAATLPAGAASIKELSSDGSVYGYSVWVKVQDATEAGNGFYWYEIIHHGGGNDTVYGNALGSVECVGCHRAGKDYSLSTLPFE